MRILIRADAGPQIGIGHVRRCLTLARMLVELGSGVRFAARLPTPIWRSQLAEFEGSAVFLGEAVSQIEGADSSSWLGMTEAEDVQHTIEGAGDYRPDVIIVDHYAIGENWHKTAKNHYSCAIVAVDDLGNRALSADLIIDQNWCADHAKKYESVNNGHAKILGGPRFSMLDQAFRKKREGTPRDAEEMPEGCAASVGIFMGGGATTPAIRQALNALIRAEFLGKIEIVTTSTNPDLASLQGLTTDQNITISLDLPHLADFFRKHTLHIGAGGSATWERFCLGAPTIALALAENQRQIMLELVEAGYQGGIDATDNTNLIPVEIALADAIREAFASPTLRQKWSDKGRALVDGQGAKRVTMAIMKSSLTIRPALSEDATLTHQWRNDARIRLTARTPDPIGPNAHAEWHANSLTNRNRLLFVGAIGPCSVGVVRFDRKNLSSTDCEVSIYLDPDLDGLGLGSRFLAAGEEALSHHWPDIRAITAETLPENLASGRLFTQSGYSGENHRYTKTLKQAETL